MRLRPASERVSERALQPGRASAEAGHHGLRVEVVAAAVAAAVRRQLESLRRRVVGCGCDSETSRGDDATPPSW